MEVQKKLTRKEKIAQGVEKAPKRKTLSAQKAREKREETIQAVLRNYPTSPRKMRLVAGLVRGQKVEKALATLKFTPNHAAVPLRKLIISAISNWEEKNQGARVEDSNLFVKEVFVDSGRMLKRFQPAPQGRAHRIRKRSNHVTLILDSKAV